MLALATRTTAWWPGNWGAQAWCPGARAPQHTHLLLPLCLRACSCMVLPERSVSVLFSVQLGELYLWLFSFFFSGGPSLVF